MLSAVSKGDIKTLARAISLIENEHPGYEEMLQLFLPQTEKKIIGITGPPGAGKSTLADALINEIITDGKRVAVLCVDPSSPFNLGALLGDRIRMSNWYTHPDVFIRSLATRGAMGGLHPFIIEIADLLKQAPYDYIVIETVGVGQSEIEIAGLADTTVVVMVPEAGDEIQTMKAGLMEIADLFVVNKSDRPEADLFVRNLRQMLAPAFSRQREEIPVLKTIASQQQGIAPLYEAIRNHQPQNGNQEKHVWLLAEKAWHLLQKKKMKGYNKNHLVEQIRDHITEKNFNLYRFVLSL